MDSNKTIFSQSGWLKVIMAILLTIIFAAVISLLTSGNIKNTTETTGTAIALTFVGILATFVVVSNYSQLKEIERKTEYDIKEQNKAISKMRDDLNDLVNHITVAYNLVNRYELLRTLGFNRNHENKKLLNMVVEALNNLIQTKNYPPKTLVDAIIERLDDVLKNEDLIRYNRSKYDTSTHILPKNIELSQEEKNNILSILDNAALNEKISKPQQIYDLKGRFMDLFCDDEEDPKS